MIQSSTGAGRRTTARLPVLFWKLVVTLALSLLMMFGASAIPGRPDRRGRRSGLRELLDIYGSINASLDVNRTLENILTAAIRVTSATHGSIVAIDWKNRQLVLRALFGQPWAHDLVLSIDSPVGVSAYVARTGHAVRIGNVRRGRARKIYVETVTEVQSEMVVPIPGPDGRPLGIIVLDSPEKHHFMPRDMRYVKLFAAQASGALRHAMDHRTSMGYELWQRVLSDFCLLVLSENHLYNILQFLIEEGVNWLVTQNPDLQGKVYANFMLYDAARGDMVLVAGVGVPPEQIFVRQPMDVGIVPKALLRNQAIYVPDVEAPDSGFHKLFNRIRTEFAIPMVYELGEIGVFNIEVTIPDALTERERTMLELLARQATIALARHYDGTFQGDLLSLVDELTQSEIPIEGSLQHIVDWCVHLFNASSAHLMKVENNRLRIMTYGGSLASMVNDLTLENCITGYAVHKGTDLLIDDVTSALWSERFKGHPEVRSEMVVLIKRNGIVTYLLNLEHRVAGYYKQRHLRLLRDVAKLVGLAFHLLEQKERQRAAMHALKGKLDLVQHNVRYALEALASHGNPMDFLKKIHDLLTQLKEVIYRHTKPANLIPVSIRGLLDRAISEMMLPSNTMIVKKYNLDSSYPALADPNFLHEVFSALLINVSEEFEEAGTVSPRIEIEICVEPDFTKVIITDNGRGIPECVRARVLEGESGKKHGSGIGLADSVNLMHRMHGQLHLEWTQPGVGTAFSVMLRNVRGLVLKPRHTSRHAEQCLTQHIIAVSDDATCLTKLPQSFASISSVQQIDTLNYCDPVDVSEAAQEPSTLVILDLVSNPAAGLAVLDRISALQTDQVPAHFDVYPLWDLPQSEEAAGAVLNSICNDRARGHV